MATTATNPIREHPRIRRPLRMPDWGAAGWAGIAGGGLFLGVEMLLLPLTNSIHPWEFVRMVAAIILGREALTGALGLGQAPFVLAMVLHFSLSIIYLRLLSPLIYRIGRIEASCLGLLFGAALYLANFHLFTGFFPWFAAARGPASLAANALFGLFSAWLYKTLERREPLVEDVF